MPYVTQSRNFPPIRLGGIHTYSGDNSKSVSVGYTYSPGSQVTTSWRTSRSDMGLSSETGYEMASTQDLRRNIIREHRTKYDNGHTFETEKYEQLHPQGATTFRVALLDAGTKRYEDMRYDGYAVLIPSSASEQWPPVDYPTQATLEADGRRAIANTAPSKPEAGLAQALAELREKLPVLTGFQTYREGFNVSSAGGEYLNYQFGVKPFINDLESVANSILDFSKIVEKYRAGSGNITRVGTSLGESSYHAVVSSGHSLRLGSRNGEYLPDDNWYYSLRRHTCADSSTQRKWFKGAFTYHVSEAHGFTQRVGEYEQLANKLLGTRITPELVYELTPWSWLLDWFVDVGTFVSNVTRLSDDATVLRYGYVMSQTETTRTRTTELTPRPRAVIPGTIQSFATVTRKTRIRATPYGFGINVANLSPQRWAILGALGMTKGPRTLQAN